MFDLWYLNIEITLSFSKKFIQLLVLHFHSYIDNVGIKWLPSPATSSVFFFYPWRSKSISFSRENSKRCILWDYNLWSRLLSGTSPKLKKMVCGTSHSPCQSPRSLKLLHFGNGNGHSWQLWWMSFNVQDLQDWPNKSSRMTV